jgi:hypothetical protein
MNTAIPNHPYSAQVAFNRLGWVGPLAIVVAIIANTLIQLVAVSVLQPDPSFTPLVGATPAVLTLFGVLGAVIAYAIIGRLSKNPIWLFKRVALVTLLLSFIPDIAMWFTASTPGTTTANVLALMLMHVVAWAISVYLLTNFART